MDSSSSVRNNEPIGHIWCLYLMKSVATRLNIGRLLSLSITRFKSDLSLMRFKGDPKFGSNAAIIFIFR